ncbi:protein-disulfide reductase DsbD [Sulfuriferula nivalis]|uniref:Thiol:disulfide interchange protein DsbD n=1 Tax=Sulfuriferula nivalis TaxID=2675298 RepID=A0A809RLN9_9PROT|nr:protein-disulfide reductase DsbD [Sulfuriferula nivalis]BBP02476.1 thiol:disulfide interchange protein DsbD [Sulfuriferula nivalis]
MRIFFILLFLFMQTISAHADELLEPEQAFNFSAQLVGNSQIEIRYKIADGYYLYRNKFKFNLKGADAGTPIYPAGIIKKDPNFGSVEIYHDEVRIKLPFTRGSENTIKLTSTAQGCAEAGVCYTPIDSTKSFNLPVSTKPIANLATPAPITQAGTLSANDFLSPEQAFSVTMTLVSPTTITAHFKIAPQYYLYQNKIHFAIKSPTDVNISKTDFPVADIKQDPNFGQMKVYHRDFTVELTLSRALNGTESLQINSDYQGCSEKGICYPPQKHSDTLGTQLTTNTASNADTGDNSQITQALHSGRFWVVMVTFFGAGLLLAFTPCVFPMIPILSGIIAGQKQVTRLSGFLLSLAYVLGMAITYAAAGVAAALSGTLLSNALQNPIALFIGAAVFVGLAFSMFGFFELQLPSAVQSKFSDASNKVKGGNFVGVFIMGALSALIVGPCVAPPLAAALAYIAQTGNTTLGGWALFSLAIGMGVPLLLIGLSAGTLLPRAGGWMNAVKYFFGVLMLAIAIWLVSPLMPIWVQMLLWAGLLIIAATYLHVLDPLPANASGWMRLWKGFGAVLMLGGIALIVGMLAGGRELLQPLSVFRPGTAVAAESNNNAIKFDRIKNNADLDAKIKQSAGKVVMLDFYADWCVSCKEMEHNTFSDPRIISKLKDIVLLQADITANSADDDALRKRFAVFGPPAIILFDAQGKELREHIIGYQTPEQFSLTLDKHLNP